MMALPPEDFDDLIAQALDSLPEELLALLDNVAITVHDDPPAENPDLLGQYLGTPLTERTLGWGSLNLPDHIQIFRRPLCAVAQDLDDLREQVAITVVHEIAHHVGFDDDALAELGWA